MVLELGEYLRIEGVTTRQMAERIGVSPMKVSTMGRNVTGWKTFIDYNMRTGKIKRVWEEKTKIVYEAERNVATA